MQCIAMFILNIVIVIELYCHVSIEYGYCYCNMSIMFILNTVIAFAKCLPCSY